MENDYVFAKTLQSRDMGLGNYAIVTFRIIFSPCKAEFQDCLNSDQTNIVEKLNF